MQLMEPLPGTYETKDICDPPAKTAEVRQLLEPDPVFQATKHDELDGLTMLQEKFTDDTVDGLIVNQDHCIEAPLPFKQDPSILRDMPLNKAVSYTHLTLPTKA